MKDIIVGIDIGTSKVSTIIAKMESNNSFTVLGKGMELCSGVKKGVIIDIEDTAQAIRTSIHKAEKMCGIKVRSAYVNIMGTYVTLINNSANITLSLEKREITVQDVEHVFNCVKFIESPENRQIIDVIPKQYIVDGHTGISDPIGMFGATLELQADIVAADITTVQNIIKSMERANIRIDGIVVEPLALGQVVVTPEEKDMGVIILDVGGGITNISVFEQGELIFCGAVNAGGDHITGDISIGLKTSNSDAEKLKREYEIALTSLIKNDQTVTIHEVNESKNKSVKVSEIVRIIEERVHEIFSLSQKLMEKFKIMKEYSGGVVLTGSGISNVDGCTQLAEQIFGVPARVVNYRKINVPGSDYVNCFGIIKFIISERKGYGEIASDVKVPQDDEKYQKSLLAKLVKFFTGAF